MNHNRAQHQELRTSEAACYAVEPVRDLAQSLTVAAGVDTPDAVILANALVDADLHGVSTHGITRLSIYLQRIQLGLIDPRAQLVIEPTRPAVLSVDAANGLGQVTAIKTLARLKPLSREYGIAAATIRHSQHFGALSHYCNLMAEEGKILLATTNGEPAMSPAGGCDAFFGTNPIAASFPTGKGFPVKIDLSTSLVARGNIVAADKADRPIPEGWALDPDGLPTTDAAAALAGTVLSMAGHKGYALALLVDLLSGVLSGAASGFDVGSMYKHLDRRQNVGHFFTLIDIAAFLPLNQFIERIDATIDRLKAGRRQPGVNEILVPGERSHRTAQHRRQHGIPITPATLDELQLLGREYGVSVTPPLVENPSPGTFVP